MNNKTSKLNKILRGAGVITALGLSSLPKSTESFTGTYISANEVKGECLVGYTFDVNGEKRTIESLPSQLEKNSTYEVVLEKPYLPIFSNRTSYTKL